jgi:hypothetical protein
MSLVLFAVFDPFSLFFIAVALGIGVAVAVTWSMISDWLDSYRNKGNIAELVKQTLASGKVSIVGNVFNSGGTKLATNQWEADSLDSELEGKFRYSNSTRMSL